MAYFRSKVSIKLWLGCLLASLVLHGCTTNSDPIRIACCSSFQFTLEDLVTDYKLKYDHDISVSTGSSGLLYAQISQGAPFEFYVSAGESYANNLCSERDSSYQKLVVGSPSLWLCTSAKVSSMVDSIPISQLGRIGIANPEVAPFGIASQSFLDRQYRDQKPMVSQAHNVSGVVHLFKTGNIQTALLPYDLAHRCDAQTKLEIPRDKYQNKSTIMTYIKADAKGQSESFWNYLSSSEAQEILRKHGY